MTRKVSKALSLWLRHAPEAGGLTLDERGWTPVAEVMAALGRAGLTNEIADLHRAVAENDKQRFELSEEGTRIRARQGHSIDIDLDWPLADPPEHLFHGTVERFVVPIFEQGLRPMARHHVHLSPDISTATNVGARRGDAVILRVAAGAMARAGIEFRLSSNGVWLTDTVPPAYLERL